MLDNNEVDENRLIAERRAKLEHIRKESKSNGHPNTFRRLKLAKELIKDFENKSKDDLICNTYTTSVAGRVMAKRGPFMVLQDVSGRIQVYANKQVQEELKEKYHGLDIGDIIGVKGQVHRSDRGELYVNMDEYELQTKALRPLPEKFHGLTDQEQRYRQRYVDLIINEESRNTMIMRSKVVAAIRQFMLKHQFMEVETPMMHPIVGGASARPFITHHNALDIDMYLRIAPELYLKRLVVGGFERAFEINRNFRNEGVSPRHNPEFTMMEFYMAYADYNDLIDFTEDLLSSIAKELCGKTALPYGEHVIEFSGPYTRMTMLEAIQHYNPDNRRIQDLSYEQIKNKELMVDIATEVGVEVESF